VIMFVHHLLVLIYELNKYIKLCWYLPLYLFPLLQEIRVRDDLLSECKYDLMSVLCLSKIKDNEWYDMIKLLLSFASVLRVADSDSQEMLESAK
jgi:hypothetical protein